MRTIQRSTSCADRLSLISVPAMRRNLWWYVGVATLVALGVDCRRTARPTGDPIGIPQQVGSWEGTGDHTIGFVSHSGKFRIRWSTRPEQGRPEGVFRLTVHSAVSGRPLQDVVEQRGAGEGTVNFEDDPRQYNLMVSSSGLLWSIVVDEIVLVTPSS
jgi:hypothetical protein